MSELTRRLLGDGGGTLRPLPLAGPRLALALDTMVEGVHFDHRTGPADLGYKALAVNLSDMAAMGATPLGGALTLVASRAQLEGRWLEAFAGGLLDLADRFGVCWRGALTRIGPLCATVEITGTLGPDGEMRRAGARPGDGIWVTGTLGDAGGALCAAPGRPSDPDRRFLEERLRRPTPRVALGQRAVGLASAAIDLSDGLGSDLGHVLRASGVSATVETARLPLSGPLLRAFGRTRAAELACASGDDYELVLTVPAQHATELARRARELACPLTRIGTVTASAAGGVEWLDPDGRPWESPRGYRHFA